MITNNLSNTSGAATFLALQMLAGGGGGSATSDDIFVATYTQGANYNWSCDKTYSEIKAAYDAGKICLGMAIATEGQIIYVGSVNSSRITWFSNYVVGDQHGKVQMISCVTHNSDNSIAVTPMSSSVLPGVTSSDNGKILGVSSGQWNTIDLPQDIFVATYTYTNSAWSCDKTFAEIKAAYDAGKLCLGLAPNGDVKKTIFLNTANSSSIQWVSNYLEGNNHGGIQYNRFVMHNSDDSIVVTSLSSTVLPSVTSSDNGKILGVSSGQWNKVDPPTELPSVTSSDNGKVLGVDNGGWGVTSDKGAPYEVEFTITGMPVGTDYPVSVTATIADISAALARGDRVFGFVSLQSGEIALAPLSGCRFDQNDEIDLVAFDLISRMSDGTIVEGHAFIEKSGGSEIVGMILTPLTPLVVNYIITGLPVDNVYPMSADATLAQIQEAKAERREIKAVLSVSGDTLELPLISYGSDFVAFSNVTQYNGEWVIFQISTSNDGVNDSSTGAAIPLQEQLPNGQGVNF